MDDTDFKVLPEQIRLLVAERDADHADMRAYSQHEAQWRRRQAENATVDTNAQEPNQGTAGGALNSLRIHADKGEASEVTTFKSSLSVVRRYDLPKITSNLTSAIVVYEKAVPARIPGPVSKAPVTLSTLPAELRNRIYEFVDGQQSFSRESKLHDRTEPVTHGLAGASKQIRDEFLAIFLKDRKFVADEQYISVQDIKKWLRIFKGVDASRDSVASFTISWSQGVVEDFCASLPNHPTYEPSWWTQSRDSTPP
ncbi:hypothetical protein Slin14017_G022160 [Septoria linicola]|nr:hypothetical protein Slin14017_G022160 [Septoria linicola]